MIKVLREVVKVTRDPLAGVIVAYKPIYITSHDVVDYFRKEYQTRKVGHGGALDPFAEGELIILLGESLKNSDEYINLTKEYEFSCVLGIQTLSGDNQEKILSNVTESLGDELKVEKVLKQLELFKKKYVQSVPILSSVKVGGYKLRELTRRAKEIKEYTYGELKKSENKDINVLVSTNDSFKLNDESRIVLFFLDDKSERKLAVKIPQRECKILDYSNIKIEFIPNEKILFNSSYSFKDEFVLKRKNTTGSSADKSLCLKGIVKVGSGTYIRKLCEDLTFKAFGLPSTLYYLKRSYT